MYLLEVYVTNASLKVNKPFTYCSFEFVAKFCRVRVRFNGQLTSAIVVNYQNVDKSLDELSAELGFIPNEIIDVIDSSPILYEWQYDLAKWIARTTISPLISCLNVMLPKNLKTSKEIASSKREVYLIKEENYNISLTTRQKEVYDSLPDEILKSEANKISRHIIAKLIDLKLFREEVRESRYVNEKPTNPSSFKELTIEQKKAYDDFIKSDKLVSLLFGVTGSGKTEVYLHLARYHLSLNKEVLILVPEISLTPQMIRRVKERFLDVIFYHSGLNDNERYEQYKRVKNAEAKIVVGTRSSIFLPFNNLGLIIIDEEHDTSYKQDSTPLYDARNVAFKLGMLFNAKILLASATPSLQSYSHALKGDYDLLQLKNRINHSLPKISVIDMTKDIKRSKSYIISEELKKAIANVLERRHQVIILLNRRGYSPIIKCADCNETLMCKDCDIPLSYHNDEHVLKCHQCGRVYKLIDYCPNCHSHNLVYYGFGTKKVYESLKQLFPEARIERMDRDNTNTKGAHEDILNRFERHEIDILIGTQMIAKGLDFPLVELVGILNADAGLMHQDYNAAKLTFDLLMQASGRSGRSEIDGKVLIQAFNVEHYVLKAVLKQDYNYFYNIEMNYRHRGHYPPYSHIIAIYLSDTSLERLNKSKDIFNELIDACPYRKYPLTSINKLNRVHRLRILVMDADLTAVLRYLTGLINEYLNKKNVSNIKVDINPTYLE